MLSILMSKQLPSILIPDKIKYLINYNESLKFT